MKGEDRHSEKGSGRDGTDGFCLPPRLTMPDASRDLPYREGNVPCD